MAAGTLAWMLVDGGNARRFEIYGMTIGAAAGLPLERALFRDERPGSRVQRAGRILVGAAGIAAFLLWDRSRSEDALLLGTLTAGLATLWMLLGAPALFRAAGLSRQPTSRPSEGTA